MNLKRDRRLVLGHGEGLRNCRHEAGRKRHPPTLRSFHRGDYTTLPVLRASGNVALDY